MKKREKIIYVFLGLAAAGFFLAGLLECILPGEEMDGRVLRSGFGEGEKTVSAVAEIEYEGNSEKEKVEFRISPAEISREEKQRRLTGCMEELPEIILAGNESLGSIEKDMNLICFHESTGVSISWESSRPDLISESGEVFPGENDKTEYVLLTASLYIGGESCEWKCNAGHNVRLTGENFGRLAERKLEELREKAESGDGGEYFELPDELAEGIKVKWKSPGESRFFLMGIIAAAAIAFIAYTGKNRRKKERENRRIEIKREFPYFLDKLVMLLSAGVILTDAVERIAEDYRRYSAGSEKKILYEELCESVDSMKNSNSSFSEELLKLAERLDTREFARLAVILKNGLESGADLAAKLEDESSLMWNERKSVVQKLGRVADTKLVFPLMIILGVLIVIVMTPAVMQM